MTNSDWRCPVCHRGYESATHKECLHAVCQARDELGEAARLNAQAAAEWEREAKAHYQAREEARAVAVRLLMLGDCLVSATDDEAWNSQVHALQTDNPWLCEREEPRCVLCGQAKPSLDPAGVCQACRIGPVEPAGEEFPHE